jgi:hypothetical protein
VKAVRSVTLNVKPAGEPAKTGLVGPITTTVGGGAAAGACGGAGGVGVVGAALLQDTAITAARAIANRRRVAPTIFIDNS